MDLLSLVTACAIAFDPAVMHGLIWHESAGEPWRYRVPGEAADHRFAGMAEAIAAANEAQARLRADDPHATLRVGLTGLEVDLGAATAEPNRAMVEPCVNVVIASTRLARLAERCGERTAPGGDPTGCALAVWRGSWEDPDWAFADAVLIEVALGAIPNPPLPPAEPAAGLADPALPQAETEPPEAPAGLFVPRGADGLTLPEEAGETLFVPLSPGQTAE